MTWDRWRQLSPAKLEVKKKKKATEQLTFSTSLVTMFSALFSGSKSGSALYNPPDLSLLPHIAKCHFSTSTLTHSFLILLRSKRFLALSFMHIIYSLSYNILPPKNTQFVPRELQLCIHREQSMDQSSFHIDLWEWKLNTFKCLFRCGGKIQSLVVMGKWKKWALTEKNALWKKNWGMFNTLLF